MGVSDFAYHDTMDEILRLAMGFMHRARQSQDDIAVRSYLWGAGRCLQEAVTIYDNRQAQNRAAIEQGEKSEKVSSLVLVPADEFMTILSKLARH